MKIQYITEPREQYVTRTKTGAMKYTRTDYTCPLCKVPYSKREFDAHVQQEHGRRYDEAYATLFGLSYPVRCSCGKELHYSHKNRGFPKTCGNCSTGCADVPQYSSAEDAHKHAEQLKQMLANAKAEEIRLKKEAELSRIPLEQLNFPSPKYTPFMRRLSMQIRTCAINGETDKLKDLANFLDKKIDG